ncbi:MAG: restriction endonuclease [Candidatus Baltobacteraceae bacterium]
MNVWLVRAGKRGENEDLALSQDLATIGWSELGDLNQYASKVDLLDALRMRYPDARPSRLQNWAGQIWAFYKTMQVGDIVAMPLKKRAAIAFGYVHGPYEYLADNLATDAVHSRSVQWVQQDVPRGTIDQDLLYSLGAFLTVASISRNNAVPRIQALVEGKAAPEKARLPDGAGESPEVESPELLDVERVARDAIVRMVGDGFRGQDLEALVAAVLRADGYNVNQTRAGADGGVDLLVGRGELGFEAPRICVQVKSSDSPEDVKTIRELQGALKNFGADHGLFVSWGGFKNSVYAEGRRSFFQVRLWDADDLIDAILRVYDRLPDEMRGKLPLKRVWAPVASEG